MLEMYPDIMDPNDVCDALRIGKNALYDLLSTGQLKAYRNGRVWRVPKQAVIEYIFNSAHLSSK